MAKRSERNKNSKKMKKERSIKAPINKPVVQPIKEANKSGGTDDATIPSMKKNIVTRIIKSVKKSGWTLKDCLIGGTSVAGVVGLILLYLYPSHPN